MQNSLVAYVDGTSQTQKDVRIRPPFRNVSFSLSLIRTLLMIYFILTEHFSLVANRTLGQFEAHCHKYLTACLDRPHSIST